MDDGTKVRVEFFDVMPYPRDSRFKSPGDYIASAFIPWDIAKDLDAFRIGNTIYKVKGAFIDIDPVRVVAFVEPFGGTFPVVDAGKVEIPKEALKIY